MSADTGTEQLLNQLARYPSDRLTVAVSLLVQSPRRAFCHLQIKCVPLSDIAVRYSQVLVLRTIIAVLFVAPTERFAEVLHCACGLQFTASRTYELDLKTNLFHIKASTTVSPEIWDAALEFVSPASRDRTMQLKRRLQLK